MINFSQILNVPSTDAEDARRRKLLNILLLGVAALSLSLLLLTTIAVILGQAGQQLETMLLYFSLLALIPGTGIIFFINRYKSGTLASVIFLLLLLLVFTFSDTPYELASGRSLFIFAIPIIMASVLLRPYASFAAAAAVGLIVSALGFSADIVPNVPAILSFFAIALVSWMSARSLERALEDLRVINRELDQRVIERTHDLAEALSRVQAESSKNQAILESIADGVIVFDNQGEAIVANPSIEHLLERSTGDIIGHDVGTIMEGSVSDNDRQMVVDMLSTQKLSRSGAKFQWGNKTLSVSFAMVRDAQGNGTGRVVVFRDFTREAELDRMKSAFVSMASHELRTPLNAILGYGDMLKEAVYGPLSNEQVHTMDRIIANAKRMLGLVNNLLDQAQIEAGRLTIRNTTVTVKDLVEDIRSMMTVLAEQKGLELICSVAEEVPQTVTSDPQRLHQILVNLMGNAVKFTEKGSVSLVVHRPDETHWQLKVIDTGTGIPEDAQAYIFEPFRQVDGSVTRNHAGSGLGLAIVKQLASLMGGDITLTSKLGYGSTFTVTLPLIPEQELVS